mmetsp:Transcript_16723/g.36678  ORF Transcript_16723/g.36678 Transcript_16723/m.36678 type:complete len:604 (+) Transcript_16723:117-1928(+)
MQIAGPPQRHAPGVLALPERGVKVNACGHLLEIAPENSTSMPLLRRDLVAQLKVCNPASVQVLDLTGKAITTDEELEAAMQDGKHPLQAKLTVAALHEIEQKKREGRHKEHDMLGLQWQIVIEQVAAFSYEVAGFGGQLQSMKDECTNMVKQFEEAEVVRREKLMTAMHDHVKEREVAQKDVLSKIEAITNLVMQERSAREVSHYQLEKQAEQVVHEMNTERNKRAKGEAEQNRSITALRNDLQKEIRENTEQWTRTLDSVKRLEQGEKDVTTLQTEHQHRLTLLDGEVNKLRVAVGDIDSAMNKQLHEVNLRLQRQSEEMERAVREGTWCRNQDFDRVAKHHETSWQSLETRFQRSREEAAKAQVDLVERTRAIELRCAALEKDHNDHREIRASSEQACIEKATEATSAVDTLAMERQVTEVALKNTSAKVEEILTRMRNVETGLDQRVAGEHWKAQVDGLVHLINKQETKIAQLEREMHSRLAMEASHRDGLKVQLQGSLKHCLSTMGTKPEEEHPRSQSERRPHSAIRTRVSTVSVPTEPIVINSTRHTSPSPIRVVRGVPSAPAGWAWVPPRSPASPSRPPPSITSLAQQSFALLDHNQ